MASKRAEKDGPVKKPARRKKAAAKVEPKVNLEYGLKELEEDVEVKEPDAVSAPALEPEPVAPDPEPAEEEESSPYLDAPVVFELVLGDTYKCGNSGVLFRRGRPQPVIDRELAKRCEANSRFKKV